MEPSTRESGPVPTGETVSSSRRALLRAGAGSAPILLTLASRPVSAAESCVVASSFVSVATFRSRNPKATTIQCVSKTVDDWYRVSCLPETGFISRPAYLATTVGAYLGSTTSSYNGTALWAVLKNGSTGVVHAGEIGVLQHLIAMKLNLEKGFASAPGNLTAPYLATVWVNYKQNGNRYSLPTSGIDWDSAKLIGWLRMLMYPIAV